MVDIQCKNLSYSFLGKRILKPTSFEIYENDKLAIFGSKNTGKTTLILILAGILNHKGKILVTSKEKLKIGLGVIEKVNNLSERMTVKENLAFYLRQGKDREKLEKFDIRNILNIRLENLSHLDKAFLSVVIASINNPDIILLDEPTEGLTESETKIFWERVRKQIENKTVVFTTSKESELINATKLIYLDKQ
jgi:ABC-type multidrug transport system ATPase subunit